MATQDSAAEESAIPTFAYSDPRFLESVQARPVRILAEYLEPLAKFRQERVHDTVVFFGSARLREDGPLGSYHSDARHLARRLTEWSMKLSQRTRRFVVCSGGGPGIMEAANRGAADAGGKTIGLNIGLPHEQRPNPYISSGLGFEFRYFFMRKFWFAYLARALVVFPGGFGTLDELMEVVTLVQTRKMRKPMPIVLFGGDYWDEVINFDALVRHGTIDAGDLKIMHRTDSVDEAYEWVTAQLMKYALANPGATM